MVPGGCTRGAQGVHKGRTRGAQGAHKGCTRGAQGAHKGCTRGAQGAHKGCTRGAQGVHKGCTRGASVVPGRCTRGARSPSYARCPQSAFVRHLAREVHGLDHGLLRFVPHCNWLVWTSYVSAECAQDSQQAEATSMRAQTCTAFLAPNCMRVHEGTHPRTHTLACTLAHTHHPPTHTHPHRACIPAPRLPSCALSSRTSCCLPAWLPSMAACRSAPAAS